MSIRSSYTKYLPSVLSSNEQDSTDFLAKALCIFEEMLTGVNSADSGFSRHPLYRPMESKIQQIPDLFNPWQATAHMLDFLAACVGFSVSEDWSEYQKRKLLSTIVSTYTLRGTKRGFYEFLNVYINTQTRPRIVVDDGEAIWRASWRTDGLVDLHALAHSTTLPVQQETTTAVAQTSSMGILLHPSAFTIDTDGNYVVVDQGIVDGDAIHYPPAIWRISRTGEIVDWEIDGSSSLPKPKPIYQGTKEMGPKDLQRPIAIVTDKNGDYFVLDEVVRSDDNANTKLGQAVIYHYTRSESGFSQTEWRRFGGDNSPFDDLMPVDMVMSKAGQLIILDEKKPQLIVIGDGEPIAHVLNDSEGKQSVTYIVKPTALVIENNDTLIITCAGKQGFGDTVVGAPYSDEDLKQLVGNLIEVKVELGMPGSVMTKTSLLTGDDKVDVRDNPLVFPTGIDICPAHVAFELTQSRHVRAFLVCDTGLKEETISTLEKLWVMAEQPAVYMVILPESGRPSIHPISSKCMLTHPVKLKYDTESDCFLLADRGFVEDRRRSKSQLTSQWRTQPHELGVVVHFSNQHFLDIPAEKKQHEIPTVIKETFRKILTLANEETPDHCIVSYVNP